MNRLIKITNNPLYQMLIGNKPLRVYSTEVSGRLGKILSRDDIGIKEECRVLGLQN